MRKTTDLKKGIYLLEIHANDKFKVGIKKFHGMEFPKGYYYYVGSAQKNLIHRLRRHIKKDKIIHWHIDHITSLPIANIKCIYVFNNKSKNFETELVLQLKEYFQLDYAVKGFGNSDDPVCDSHLLFSKRKISQSQFFSRYHSTVRFIPSSIETF